MLYGQRVTLRPVVEEDWELRYEWLSDPVVNRTLPSGSGMPLTPEVVRERTRSYAQTDPSAVYFTIIKEDGIAIGSTQLFKIHPWSKHAEFGIWIGNKMVWGKGYATEVTSVVLDFAFERLNLHKVYLTVDADNPGAIRSYEKAGFKKDGILRDEVYKNGQYVDRILMSILKHEYLKLSNCFE
ncbi:acetyltransferase [Paenibacillus glucanolyticus]|uniref:Acetyltransferase n=1 Tax=Paenibacillus glucanolyticus TaxID=59843 RepID=A0A163LSQ0_9BACL|nr:GNAT family protein [Paenibacillus glucanolyticus]KZS48426.1 acetyltransferase [Paenibacillus glucanolyticus]